MARSSQIGLGVPEDPSRSIDIPPILRILSDVENRGNYRAGKYKFLSRILDMPITQHCACTHISGAQWPL